MGHVRVKERFVSVNMIIHYKYKSMTTSVKK